MAERPMYPGNSNAEKEEEQKSTIIKEERKNITKVTTGTVTRKKKSLSDSFAAVFFGNEARNVGNYILYDVLIPAAKDTITNMVKIGIEMLVYGETKRDGLRRDKDRTVISYDRYYDRDRDRDRGSRRDRDRNEPRPAMRSRYNFDDIVFERRSDAETVLSVMNSALEDYDCVTVAEFFHAADLRSEHVDENYGWENLRDAYVHRVRNGYAIDMPRPKVLND